MTQGGLPQGGVALRGVTKRYGPVTAVESLDLEIAPGSYTCLLGPSGCGKTTTLRMIAGHESITAGEIWIGDRQVNGVPAAKRNTAMVFQNYALFPHKTVAENIAFGLKMRGVTKAEQRQRVAEILTLVNLEAFAKRKPDQLSGGQQQRVALARALVTRPQVVLLDEPLSALDESLRVKTRQELRKLQRQFGMTFIQVTHAQDEAFALSDRVVVMDEGRIDQVGKPAAVFNRPASQFVARFVGDNNILQGTVVETTANAAFTTVELNVPGMGSVFCQGRGAGAGGVPESGGPGSREQPQAGQPQVGQTAACSVRGDRLQLLPPDAPPEQWPNRLKVRVAAVEFTGFVSRISLVNLSDGREFLLKIQTEDWLQSGHSEEDVILLGWRLEDCVFLPH